MPNLCQRYAQNMLKISSRYAQDIFVNHPNVHVDRPVSPSTAYPTGGSCCKGCCITFLGGTVSTSQDPQHLSRGSFITFPGGAIPPFR